MKKMFVGALCAVATTTATATPAAASGNLLDRLYEDIVEEYWIWAFNQPEDVNPLLGNAPFCTESESGHVAFLSGTFLDGPQERSCEVELGQWLYLSVLSGVYIAFESDPPETKTEDVMRELADCVDATATVTVDGFTFNATKSYTETGVFDFPVAEGGLLEALLEGENTDGAVASGIHVVIPPLLPGKHKVSWHAESMDCGYDTDGDGVPDEKAIKDISYVIKVTLPSKGKGKDKDKDKGKGNGKDNGNGNGKDKDKGNGKDKGKDNGNGNGNGKDKGKDNGNGKDNGKGKGKGH